MMKKNILVAVLLLSASLSFSQSVEGWCGLRTGGGVDGTLGGMLNVGLGDKWSITGGLGFGGDGYDEGMSEDVALDYVSIYGRFRRDIGITSAFFISPFLGLNYRNYSFQAEGSENYSVTMLGLGAQGKYYFNRVIGVSVDLELIDLTGQLSGIQDDSDFVENARTSSIQETIVYEPSPFRIGFGLVLRLFGGRDKSL